MQAIKKDPLLFAFAAMIVGAVALFGILFVPAMSRLSNARSALSTSTVADIVSAEDTSKWTELREQISRAKAEVKEVFTKKHEKGKSQGAVNWPNIDCMFEKMSVPAEKLTERHVQEWYNHYPDLCTALDNDVKSMMVIEKDQDPGELNPGLKWIKELPPWFLDESIQGTDMDRNGVPDRIDLMVALQKQYWIRLRIVRALLDTRKKVEKVPGREDGRFIKGFKDFQFVKDLTSIFKLNIQAGGKFSEAEYGLKECEYVLPNKIGETFSGGFKLEIDPLFVNEFLKNLIEEDKPPYMWMDVWFTGIKPAGLNPIKLEEKVAVLEDEPAEKVAEKVKKKLAEAGVSGHRYVYLTVGFRVYDVSPALVEREFGSTPSAQ